MSAIAHRVPSGHPPRLAVEMRRLLVPLVITFLVLDLAALALLGPVSPADTIGDITRLYGDRRELVLASRLIHSLGLVVAFAFFGIVCGRLRQSEDGTLTRIIFGGFIALVPIEIVRNVTFAALALRFDDFGDAALPLHVVAVLLGPAIAFPLIAALTALATLRRSMLILLVAGIWLMSTVRLLTISSVLWYAGLAAFVGLLIVLIHLALTFGPESNPSHPDRHTDG